MQGCPSPPHHPQATNFIHHSLTTRAVRLSAVSRISEKGENDFGPGRDRKSMGNRRTNLSKVASIKKGWLSTEQLGKPTNGLC